jgi:beta-glucosidase
LGHLIPYICTINEANIGKQIAKIMKRMMAGANKKSVNKQESVDVQVGLNVDLKASFEQYNQALGEAFGIDPKNVHTFISPQTDNGELIIMKCHEVARTVIKEINPNIKVGITFSLYDHQALPGGEPFVEKEQHEDFLNYLPFIQEDDFLGVQNYSRKIHGPDGVVQPDENTRVTKMGYEYYPEALGNVIRFVSKHWDKPIIVTENGISTDHDEDRVEFIERALVGVYQCIEEGINVRGYTYWSLLDNFEWQLGYAQTFGLIAVDRTTQTRYPKDSLAFLGNIKKAGLQGLEV